MLSAGRLKQFCSKREINISQLAEHIARPGLSIEQARRAVNNWQKGLFKPVPQREDIARLADAFGVNENDLKSWCSSYRFAPMSARKVRLVTELIVGRSVQDADEQQADVDQLYVSSARVDDAGVRIGTKRWIPKDRGRAHAIAKKGCHIHLAVSQSE
jgi:hypothetical protein